MAENQASQIQLEVQLARRFKYVEPYWDGGNFKGYIASNNRAKVDEFLGLMGDTTTEFSSTEVAKAKSVSADGSIVDFPAKSGQPIRYFMKGGKWHYLDSRGREQKEVEGKQQEITDYYKAVKGGLQRNVTLSFDESVQGCDLLSFFELTLIDTNRRRE